MRHGVGSPYLACAERCLHMGAINEVVLKVIIVEGIWMQERRRRLTVLNHSIISENVGVYTAHL